MEKFFVGPGLRVKLREVISGHDNAALQLAGGEGERVLQELVRPYGRRTRGTFTGSWAIGETKAVSLANDTASTVAVTNYCVGVTQSTAATATLNVIFGNASGTASVVEIQQATATCLMVAGGLDYTTLPGYSPGVIQLLGHSAADMTTNATACATLTWYSVTSCGTTT